MYYHSGHVGLFVNTDISGLSLIRNLVSHQASIAAPALYRGHIVVGDIWAWFAKEVALAGYDGFNKSLLPVSPRITVPPGINEQPADWQIGLRVSYRRCVVTRSLNSLVVISRN